MPRRTLARASTLALCILVSACRSPGPVPDIDPPLVDGPGGPAELDARPESALPLAGALSVRDVVRRALAASPELRAAFARVRAAEAMSRVERTLPNPVASVSFRLAEAGASPGLDLGLVEDLFALATRADRADAADARLRAAVEEAVTIALDTSAAAAELAVAVRASDDRLPLLEERVRILGRVRDAAASRVADGEGRPLDVTTADEEIAAAELDVADAREEARAARIALASRLGRPHEDAGWTVAASGPDEGPSTEPEWTALALDRRPEIRSLDWEIAALEAEARLAGLAPHDGLAAGFDAEGTRDWQAGPSISIPVLVFDDGAARRDVAAARIDDARHRREEAAARATHDVRAAWLARESARSVRRIAEQRLLPLAERRREEAEAVHAAGEADLADVLLAARALTDARLRIAALRAREDAAEVRLRRAAGGAAPRSRVHAVPGDEKGNSDAAR